MRPARCQYAACSAYATARADGWDLCAPHLAEHHALADERVCAGCGATFTPSRPNIRRCDDCRHVRVAARRRSDAGKRREPDSPINRCTHCGEWRWGVRACSVCEVAA